MRLATFAHAMSITNPTAASRMTSGCLTVPTRLVLHGDEPDAVAGVVPGILQLEPARDS
jgi:hypothetical protein